MAQPLIRFQDVFRDGIQSLFGTNPSAQEMIDAYPTAHLTGTVSIQTGGGTFFDLFAQKGRDEWDEVETLISHFKSLGVRQSALVRGDFLFSYEPQPYDVIRATVFEYAKMGMNILQNFHGMNDARCLVGVVKAVNEAREEGFDIVAQGAICIEDNPNVNIDSCLAFAQELVDLGHEGFYLKSASGRLNPEFVYDLTAALYDHFPEQEITIHAHSTYGESPACYMAAAKAAIERGKPITMDVQHPALSGSTAQPSMNKIAGVIRSHPDTAISSQAPKLNIDAIKESMRPLFALRFRYREFESSYNSNLLDAMYYARTPGGASSTLKSIPGLVDNLERLLAENNQPATWDDIQIAIYKMQAEILKDIGQPTQVTPYAANTTGQAALSLWHELEGRYRYHTLYPGIANYLVGRHGRVPDSVNPKLIKQALESHEAFEYILSTDRDDKLPAAKEKLQESGIPEPTIRQMLSTVLTSSGYGHVLACYFGTNAPQQPPALPFYAQEPPPLAERHIAKDGKTPTRDIRDAVMAIGGVSKLQEIAERTLHLKQIADELYIFPYGSENLKQQWYDINAEHLAELTQSIPGILQKTGFTKEQAHSMHHQWVPNNIHACIKDAVNHKGKGLYEFLCEALKEYRET